MKKIYCWEPWVFIFFGIFHLHRIWALVDRESYASFWIGMMENKGLFYYIVMGILVVSCVLGIITFLKKFCDNIWWRWIYVIGGCYILFDLFAIAAGMEFWQRLLYVMFDTNTPFWNIIWGFFILLGGLSACFGIWLFAQRRNGMGK